MITVLFNDEKISISAHHSLLALLTDKGHQHHCCAVALNRQFVPRAHYGNTILQHNDIIETVVPMQGG